MQPKLWFRLFWRWSITETPKANNNKAPEPNQRWQLVKREQRGEGIELGIQSPESCANSHDWCLNSTVRSSIFCWRSWSWGKPWCTAASSSSIWMNRTKNGVSDWSTDIRFSSCSSLWGSSSACPCGLLSSSWVASIAPKHAPRVCQNVPSVV